MSSQSPSHVWKIYSISLLLCLVVLALSLLDLGFGSLFLGIVGPIATFVHHGCSAFFLRKYNTAASSLVGSTPSIITVALLFAVWLVGSIVVTVWATFYLNGSAQLATQAISSPGTVMAQGVVGVIESLVLLSLFATLLHARRRQNLVEFDEKTQSQEFSSRA